MNREAAWKMLDKPLRSILVYAAHEEEPPAADEDEDTPTPRRSNMNRPRGRMRRGGRGAGQSHTSWLPTAASHRRRNAPYYDGLPTRNTSDSQANGRGRMG